MLTHYNELKDLIKIVERLVNRCERAINAHNNVYKVYFNN